MPELRQNLATKEWVVIATERAVRPEAIREQQPKPAPLPEREPSCPFCPGNEKMSETISVQGDPGRWRLRVVKNQFPFFVSGAPRLPEGRSKLYSRLPAEGVQEIVVESPAHDKSLAELPREQVRGVIVAYQERFRAVSDDLKVSLTMLFKNHGAGAGTSLGHPHSQIIGSSVVPAHIRHRMDDAEKYFKQNNECVICRMVEEEKAQGERIIVESPYFNAFVLFAALSPFHIWIVPKRHNANFGDITAAEAEDLSGVLQTVLLKIFRGLGDPAYNFVLQSNPQDRGTTEAFHWYLSLVVRLGKATGFEMGSGMYINNVVPEESARFLNSIKA